MYVPIGYTIYDRDFAIDLNLHTWMIGQSGVGKSTVMTNAFIQLLRGNGCCFIDPHGTAADKILRFIPRDRVNDVIYIDLSAEAVPGIIPQYTTKKEEQLFKRGLISMLRSLHRDRWGDETERVIKGAVEAVTEYYGFINIPAIYLFIARDSFRKKVLAKCSNPLLADFSEQYDEKLRESEQMSKFSPPLNKIDEFVEPTMRPVTSNEKTIDWVRAMNDQKIVIVRLPKGEISEEVACLTGAIIVLNFKIAALRRQFTDPQFYLFIDECQNFMGSVDFETFASELRKYNISLFLATQYLDHFPSLSALFGNFPNAIIYRVSGKDAMIIEENYLDPGLAHQLVNLENYHFICRYVRNGLPIPSDLIRSKNKVKKLGNEPPKGAVIAESLRRWGANTKEGDEKILKFLTPDPKPDKAVGSPRPSGSRSKPRVRH